MTQGQRAELRRLLCELAPAELHHGCAVGADAERHEIALDLGIAAIVVQPSNLLNESANIRRDGVGSVVTALEPKKPRFDSRDERCRTSA